MNRTYKPSASDVKTIIEFPRILNGLGVKRMFDSLDLHKNYSLRMHHRETITHGDIGYERVQYENFHGSLQSDDMYFPFTMLEELTTSVDREHKYFGILVIPHHRNVVDIQGFRALEDAVKAHFTPKQKP